MNVEIFCHSTGLCSGRHRCRCRCRRHRRPRQHSFRRVGAASQKQNSVGSTAAMKTAVTILLCTTALPLINAIGENPVSFI